MFAFGSIRDSLLLKKLGFHINNLRSWRIEENTSTSHTPGGGRERDGDVYSGPRGATIKIFDSDREHLRDSYGGRGTCPASRSSGGTSVGSPTSHTQSVPPHTLTHTFCTSQVVDSECSAPSAAVVTPSPAAASRPTTLLLLPPGEVTPGAITPSSGSSTPEVFFDAPDGLLLPAPHAHTPHSPRHDHYHDALQVTQEDVGGHIGSCVTQGDSCVTQDDSCVTQDDSCVTQDDSCVTQDDSCVTQDDSCMIQEDVRGHIGSCVTQDDICVTQEDVGGHIGSCVTQEVSCVTQENSCVTQEDVGGHIGSCVTQDDSCVTQEVSCVTQEDSCVTQEDVRGHIGSCVTQDDSCVTQEDSCVTQEDSCVTQEDSCVTQDDSCLTQEDVGGHIGSCVTQDDTQGHRDSVDMTQEDIVEHKDREGRDSVWGSSPQQYVFSVGQKHGDGLETQVNGDCVSERVSSSANSRVLAKNSDASDGQVGDTVHVTKSQVWLDTSVVSRTSDINKKGCMCLQLTEYLYSAAHLDGSTAQNSSERNLGGRQEVMMATLSPTTCCTTTDIHLRSKSGGSTTHLPTEAFPGCTKDDQAAITTTNDSSTDTHHPHTQMIVDEQQDTVWNDSRGTLTDKHTQSSPQNLAAGVGYQNTTTTDKRKPFNQRHLAEFVPIQKASGENLREETRRIVMMLRNDKTCKVPRPSLGLQDRVQSLVQRSTGKRTSYIKGPRFCNTFVKTIVKQSHDKLQTRRDSFQELKKSRREQTAQRVLVNPVPCYGGVDVSVSTTHGPPSDVDGGVGWPHQDGAATWRDDKETPALTLTAVSPSSTITASRGYSLQKDMNYQQENRDKNKGDEVTDANKTDINKQCINMNEVEHLSREMVAVARSLDGGSVGNLNQNTQHLPGQQEFNNHMVLQRKSIGATESSVTLQGKLTNTIDQYCVSSWPLVSQMNRSDVTHQPVPTRDVVSQPSETMVDSDPVCERDYVAVDVNEEHNKTDEVLGETAGRSTIMSGSSDHPTTSVFSTSVSSTSASSTSASSTSASSTSTSSTSVSSTSTSSTSVSSTSVSSATVSSTKVSLISRISDKMEVLLTTASTETTDSSSSLKNKSESMKCTRKPSGDTVDLKAHIASLNKVSLNHRGSVQKRQFNGQNVKTSPSTLSEVMDTDTGGSANMSVTPGTDQTPSVKHEGNLFIQGDANSTGVTRLWPSAAIMTQQDASSANSDHLQKPEREGEESSSSWSCLGDIIRLKTDNLVARHRGIRSRLYSITTLPQHPKTQQSSSSVPPQRSKTRPFTTNVRPQHEVDGVISGDKSGDTVDSRPPLPINNRQGSVDGRPPIHPTSRQSSIDDQPHPPNSRQGSVDISNCVGQRNSERYPRPRHDSTDGQGSFQPERRRNRSNTRHRDSRQDSKSRVNPVSRSGSINTCLTHPGERRDSKIVGVRSGSCCGSRVSFGQDLLRKFLEVAVDQYDSMEWEETQVEENTTNSTLLQEELNSSLRKAVCHRNAEETRSLLKLGADPNVSCGPSPALLRAAKDGTLYVLQALLAAGADADARSDLGNSALHVAARSGYSEVAIQLVNSGAFVDAINRSGVTPLQMALAHGHLEVARTLLRLNADVFLPNKVGETAYEVMNQLGYMGLTACPREMRRDSAPGSKVESPSTQIPLPVRLIKAIEDGCPATVETCLAEGAPPNTMVPLALHWPARATVLHRAAHHGHDLIVRLLLAAGSDINKKDVVGNTPLHAATQAGHNRVVKILLGHGALLDAASQSGMTSLHRAASKGKELTCNLLLRRGANPRAEDNAGRTPADWARKRGFKSVAKKLVYRRKNSVTLEGESQQHQHYLHRLNQLHQAALRGGHQQPDTPDCCEE